MTKEAAPPKAVSFTLRIEPELRDAFAAATAANHVPAGQQIRQMMRDYVASNAQAPLPFDSKARKGKARGKA